MALDLIILSVLRTGPVHGYELKRRVERPALTSLSNNSLYPALRRFEAAGAVTSAVEEQEGKPPRTVYSITGTGRDMFASLIATLPVELAGNDEEFLARLSFFGEISPADRLAILGARSTVLEERMSRVRILLSESEVVPAREWRTLALRQLLARLEQETSWISELSTRASE